MDHLSSTFILSAGFFRGIICLVQILDEKRSGFQLTNGRPPPFSLEACYLRSTEKINIIECFDNSYFRLNLYELGSTSGSYVSSPPRKLHTLLPYLDSSLLSRQHGVHEEPLQRLLC